MRRSELESVPALCAEARRIVTGAEPSELYWLNDLAVLLRVGGKADHWKRLLGGGYRRNESAALPRAAKIDHGTPAARGSNPEVDARREERLRKASAQ
ncbi:MAG: hypothetical protein ACKVX7_12575 [Planctomycetota bacterium]